MQLAIVANRSCLNELADSLNNCGSGILRIARTMFKFAARQEAKTTVINVNTAPDV